MKTDDTEFVRWRRKTARRTIGLPGQGRKTSYPDRKKEASRKACRRPGSEE